MNKFIRICCLLAVSAVVAGCSTPGAKQAMCIVAGSLVGGAAARLGTDDSDPATAAAAVAGGAIGAMLCAEEPKPAPQPAPKPAPKPAVKPKPQPKPDPDSDFDGIVDRLDECPGTARGTKVDKNGCPFIPNLQGVHFKFDGSSLTDDAQRILDAAIETLSANQHVSVNIVGHTDSVGTQAYNLNLSQKRADSVSRYLEKNGIARLRLNATGKGESSPVADNATSDGRRQNRRVELTARPSQ